MRSGCKTGCHHYSYPTIIKWDLIKTSQHNGVRDGIMSLGQKRRMVSGGIHLTRGAFLPTTIIKDFSASEDVFFTGAVNWDFLLTATLKQLNEEQRRVYDGFYRPFEKFALGWELSIFISLILNTVLDDVNSVEDISPEVPRYLACNRQRFPYWFGQNDPRNKKILQALREFGANTENMQSKCEYLFKTKLEYSNTTGVEYVNICWLKSLSFTRS